MTIKNVVKRNGEVVPFEAEKLNKWGEWATKADLAWSDIVLDTLDNLYEGCSTQDIHKAMINTCVDRKSEKYLEFAARLLRGDLYKTVYGSSIPDPFSTSYKKLVAQGYWKDFNLSEEELELVSSWVDYAADKTYEYTSLLQFIDKYALSKYVNGKKVPVESPNLALMGISLALFREDGLQHVKNFYNIIKERKLNIATPIMAAARTNFNEFTSCFLSTTGDTLDSIMAGNNLAYTMTANRSGVGFEYDIRSYGDIVGNNKCKHAGKLPHYEMLLKTIKSVTQGVRGGAGTVYFNILDPEFDDLIRLKNPTTPLSKRIELLDYSVIWNNEFLRRVSKNEDWLLVSKVDAPDLHDSFYNNRDKFSEILEKYLSEHSKIDVSDFLSESFNSGQVKKGKGVVVNSRDLFKTFLKQRQETGRIYCGNVDTLNDNSPYDKDVVRMLNLCSETALPTRGFYKVSSLDNPVSEDDGLVGLCFLLATDWGKCSVDEIEYVNYYACRALDNIIEMTYYPFETLRDVGHNYRSIGVGITNLAYTLAKNGVSFDSEEGRNLVHRIAEKHQHSLYKASNDLAKERGAFGWQDRTKISKGLLCVDTYTKEIDNHHSQELLCDWVGLKKDVSKHGLRFSTHSAHMPCESSSGWGYSTNGVLPIRQGVLMKSRPEGLVPFFAPEYEKYKAYYQLAWDIETKDLYKIYGIIQKFTCQSISADTYIDFSQLVDGKVPMKKMMQDMLFSMKIGMKSHYYSNSKTENKGDTGNNENDADCESCKL